MDIDPSKVIMDPPPQAEGSPTNTQQPEGNQEIPSDQVVMDDIPSDQVTLDSDKYQSPMQQAGTALEGVAQGMAGPVATAAELGLSKLGVPNMSAQDIAGRQAANPGIHAIGEGAGLIGGLATGVGEAALAEKAAAKLMGEAGSKFLSRFIAQGAIQGGDEISKAMLGQGDPEHPVAGAIVNVGAAGLIGGALGSALSGVSKGFESVENSKLGQWAKKGLTGLGIAAKMQEMGVPLEQAEEFATNHIRSMGAGDSISYKDVKPGIDAYSGIVKGITNKGLNALTDIGGAIVGSHYGEGMVGGLIADKIVDPMVEKTVGPLVEKLVGKGVGITARGASNAVLRALAAGETDNLGTIINYARAAAKGAGTIQKALDSMFVPGQQVYNYTSMDKDREKLRKYVEEGGINKELEQSRQQELQNQPQAQYAKGGQVTMPVSNAPSNNPIANVFPEQNTMLNATKARVYNYLNSIRPMPSPTALPYDTKPDTRHQDRNYDKALDIANNPLSVLNDVKDGSVTINQLKHLTGMYPELYSHLTKQLTSRMLSGHVNGDSRPDYKLRQSLSMFLGTPLDSTFQPQSIMAAQAAFAQKPQQPQQSASPSKSGGNKKGTSSLSKMASDTRTDAEARAQRKDK